MTKIISKGTKMVKGIRTNTAMIIHNNKTYHCYELSDGWKTKCGLKFKLT